VPSDDTTPETAPPGTPSPGTPSPGEPSDDDLSSDAPSSDEPSTDTSAGRRAPAGPTAVDAPPDGREHGPDVEGSADVGSAAAAAADEAGPAAAGRPRRLRARAAGWGRGARRRWARWGPRLRVAAFAMAGAIVVLFLAGRVPAKVGPFETTVAVRPSLTGETLVHLAPLGTISLDTHDAPVRLDLRVEELGLDEAERIAANPALVDRLGDDLADEVRDALVRLAIRCVVLALVGGLLGALVARAHWRSALAGVAAGALLATTVGGTTAATFDAEAVAEPRYTGLLTVAPRAVGDVEAIVERFGEYRAQLSDLVGNIVTLYLAAEGLPTFEPGDGMIRVLHVSDVHLNPQAFDLIDQMTEQFGIDAVLDTGDLTDWGTGTEKLVVDLIGDVGVPYVYVRGNHDSAAIERAVADQPNAVVLDGQAEEVAGLRIWGIGDPRYTPDKEEGGDTDTERERIEEFAPEAADELAAARPPDVDVAMIHDPRGAADMGGLVPLVLSGHTHKAARDTIDDDTLVLTQGSTGGAGLRGLQEGAPEPLEASVLYFDEETHLLVAYDQVTVQGLGETGVTIERHVMPAGAPDEPGDERSGGTDGGPAGSVTTVTTNP
jgi:predicted phosphodiesterase